VLAVEEHPPSFGAQERHGVAHHREVLLERRAQRPLDVPHVGLSDERDDRRLGFEQGANLGVVLDPHAGLAGRTERHHDGVPQLQLAGRRAGEELGVLRHRTGPAAFDEPDADLVEQPGNDQLVGDRVGDSLTLGSVAQGGVEDVEVVGLHLVSFGRPGRSCCGQTKDPPRMRRVCASVWSRYRRANR
jgi:hypothetical protein